MSNLKFSCWDDLLYLSTDRKHLIAISSTGISPKRLKLPESNPCLFPPLYKIYSLLYSWTFGNMFFSLASYSNLLLLLFSRQVVSNSGTPWTTRLLCPWGSPGKNTGVGCQLLLQEIFPTRNQTSVSCIGRQILDHWDTKECLVLSC